MEDFSKNWKDLLKDYIEEIDQEIKDWRYKVISRVVFDC